MDFEPTNKVTKLLWVGLPLVIGMVTPSAVLFYLEVLVGHISPVAAVLDIRRRQFAEGHNLFLLALFGLIPFVLLSMTSLLVCRRLSASRLACIIIGGLAGILAFMVPSHVAIWYRLYGGGHMSSTAVIAFIFIVTLVIGALIGWAISCLLLRAVPERN